MLQCREKMVAALAHVGKRSVGCHVRKVPDTNVVVDQGSIQKLLVIRHDKLSGYPAVLVGKSERKEGLDKWGLIKESVTSL